MTAIKRFNPDYKMHSARFEAFARETEHGEYVRFEDHQQEVSTLKAERDALAVENAALIESLDSICNAYNEGLTDLLDITVEMAVKLQTPATDAALAAIRAEAVEDAVTQVLSVDTIASTAVISHLLRTYATELREGK